MGRDGEVRSEQGGSIRWKVTYGYSADSVAGELQPWTEWSGDVSYVQQKTQHGLGLIGKVSKLALVESVRYLLCRLRAARFTGLRFLRSAFDQTGLTGSRIDLTGTNWSIAY